MRGVIALLVFAAYPCRTAAPTPQPTQAEPLHSVASWYGQEYVGRTTANGDIFDPMLLTAAHLFFFNDTAATEIYTLSLHDALPICLAARTGKAKAVTATARKLAI